MGKAVFLSPGSRKDRTHCFTTLRVLLVFFTFALALQATAPEQGVLAVSGSSASAHSYFKTGDESFPGDTSSCSWGWTQDPSLSKGLRGGGDRCHLPAITAMGHPQPCSPKKPTYFTYMPTAHEVPEDVGKLCPGCSSRQASDCTFVPRELPVTWDGNGPGCSELQPRAWGCCRL